MALSQLVTQVPGGLIKSAEWNNEFQNILTHPIALISPSTGAINFALQAHTNLIPSAITATSASAGQALMSTGGTTVSFQSVASLSVTATGSTGQVLAITSSNTAPAWQVIPISGGLTSGTVSTGTLFYVSSSGVLTPLPVGTTGQVLTVVSSLPTWSSSGLGSASATLDPETSLVMYDDFFNVNLLSSSATPTWGIGSLIGSTANSITSGVYLLQSMVQWTLTAKNANVRLSLSTTPGGKVQLINSGGGAGTGAAAILPCWGAPSTSISAIGLGYGFSASQKPTFKTAFQAVSTSGSQMMIGFTDTVLDSTTFTSAALVMTTATGGAVKYVTHSSAGETVASLGVNSSDYHKYQIAVSTSQVDFYVDGVLTTSITTNVPTSGLFPCVGIFSQTVSGTNNGIEVDYILVQSTSRR